MLSQVQEQVLGRAGEKLAPLAAAYSFDDCHAQARRIFGVDSFVEFGDPAVAASRTVCRTLHRHVKRNKT